MTLAQETKQKPGLSRFLGWDRLRAHTFLNSLANNVASPFVGYNVTSSGASALLIGYVQAIGSLASSITQLIGGILADRTGKRVNIAFLFSVITGLLWLGSALLQTPTFLAITFTLITLSIGFYSAGWSAIVGEASEEKGRGSFLADFAKIASIGGLLALVLITILTAVYPSYTMIYLLSGGFFIFSAVVLVGQKEQIVERKTQPGNFRRPKGVERFYLVSGVYGLFWGFAWPLFTITIVKIVKVDLFEYSLSQMIAVASTVAFQPVVGKLVDKDRKAGVFWGRMGLVIYPIGYILISAPWHLYLLNLVTGFTNSLLNIAFIAYLYDISPAGERGRFTAEFGLVQGASAMAGSLISAYALTTLSVNLSLWWALAYLYLVAAGGRTIAAFLHLSLPYAGNSQLLLQRRQGSA